jgi:hypothetical protein
MARDERGGVGRFFGELTQGKAGSQVNFAAIRERGGAPENLV